MPARVLHLPLANKHLRARRAASHRLQPSGPVPGGDRARLAGCSDMPPPPEQAEMPLGAALYARLVVLGADAAAIYIRLLTYSL